MLQKMDVSGDARAVPQDIRAIVDVLCDACADRCNARIERANLSIRCVSMLKHSSMPVPEGRTDLDGGQRNPVA
jgi:hypothetical protein